MGKDELVEVNTKCDTTGSCASVFDEKRSEQRMFCDEQNLCGKHNITSGECAEVCRFIGVAILSSLHCSYTEFIALHCITIAVRLKFTIIRLPL